MFFANPLGLLGLLSLPAIVGIHMFQRRFPQLDVAGLHLWDLELKVKKSGRRIDRLPISRTLVLELICGLAITLLLAQPRISTTSTINRWLIVLDNSASMSAVSNSGQSFKQRAIDAIEEQVASNSAEVTILLTGRRPTTLAGPRVRWSEAKLRMESWEPSDRLHGFQTSWDMAAELAAPQDRLLFITDHLPQDELDLPARMSVVAIGEPLDNLCFETARWTRGGDSNEDQLFVRISNQSDERQSGMLVGSFQGEEIFRQAIEMSGNTATPFQSALPQSLKRLDLRIESERDGLAADSRVTLLQPELRTIKYNLDLGDSAENQHAARKSLEKILGLIRNTREDPKNPDIVFANINQPVVGSSTLTWIGMGPFVPPGETNGDPGANRDAEPADEDELMPEAPDESESSKREPGDVQVANDRQSTEEPVVPRASKGPFLIDRRDPLLEGVTLDGVFWAGIMPVNFGAVPLVSTGSWVLMGRAADSNLSRLYFNVDLGKSNLLSSQDWPVLISNIVELTRERMPGLRSWNYQIGESIKFTLSSEQFGQNSDRSLKLKYTRADGTANEKLVARLPEIDIPPLTETGVYEIHDQELLDSFAVNFFDTDESNLRHLNQGERIGVSTPALSPQARETNLTWLWWLLLAAAGSAMVLDWVILRPRKS